MGQYYRHTDRQSNYLMPPADPFRPRAFSGSRPLLNPPVWINAREKHWTTCNALRIGQLRKIFKSETHLRVSQWHACKVSRIWYWLLCSIIKYSLGLGMHGQCRRGTWCVCWLSCPCGACVVTRGRPCPTHPNLPHLACWLAEGRPCKTIYVTINSIMWQMKNV